MTSGTARGRGGRALSQRKQGAAGPTAHRGCYAQPSSHPWCPPGGPQHGEQRTDGGTRPCSHFYSPTCPDARTAHRPCPGRGTSASSRGPQVLSCRLPDLVLRPGLVPADGPQDLGSSPSPSTGLGTSLHPLRPLSQHAPHEPHSSPCHLPCLSTHPNTATTVVNLALKVRLRAARLPSRGPGVSEQHAHEQGAWSRHSEPSSGHSARTRNTARLWAKLPSARTPGHAVLCSTPPAKQAGALTGLVRWRSSMPCLCEECQRKGGKRGDNPGGFLKEAGLEEDGASRCRKKAGQASPAAPVPLCSPLSAHLVTCPAQPTLPCAASHCPVLPVPVAPSGRQAPLGCVAWTPQHCPMGGEAGGNQGAWSHPHCSRQRLISQ